MDSLLHDVISAKDQLAHTEDFIKGLMGMGGKSNSTEDGKDNINLQEEMKIISTQKHTRNGNPTAISSLSSSSSSSSDHFPSLRPPNPNLRVHIRNTSLSSSLSSTLPLSSSSSSLPLLTPILSSIPQRSNVYLDSPDANSVAKITGDISHNFTNNKNHSLLSSSSQSSLSSTSSSTSSNDNNSNNNNIRRAPKIFQYQFNRKSSDGNSNSQNLEWKMVDVGDQVADSLVNNNKLSLQTSSSSNNISSLSSSSSSSSISSFASSPSHHTLSSLLSPSSASLSNTLSSSSSSSPPSSSSTSPPLSSHKVLPLDRDQIEEELRVAQTPVHTPKSFSASKRERDLEKERERKDKHTRKKSNSSPSPSSSSSSSTLRHRHSNQNVHNHEKVEDSDSKSNGYLNDEKDEEHDHPNHHLNDKGENKMKNKSIIMEETQSMLAFESSPPTSSPSSSSSTPLSSPSFSPFRLSSLLAFFSSELFLSSPPSDDHLFHSTQPRQLVYNFLILPFYLEKAITFGCFVCFDCFLYFFTFLPWRVIVIMIKYTIWKAIKMILSVFYPSSSSSSNYHPPLSSSSSSSSSTRLRILHSRELRDILRLLLLLVGWYFLSFIPLSRIYHYVRGQSVLKLYVIFNMLQMSDRLFVSFGEDILDSLFGSIYMTYRPAYLIFHFIISSLYVFLHSLLLFVQVITLNVALNSDNSSLFVVLVSNNFVELKGAVFKRIDHGNLMQMTCSDIVERFQLALYVVIIIIQNVYHLSNSIQGAASATVSTSIASNPAGSALPAAELLPSSSSLSLDPDSSYLFSLFFSLLTTLFPIISTYNAAQLSALFDWISKISHMILMILGSEILVDWIKHGFITKFNGVSPNIYKAFRLVIAKDLCEGYNIKGGEGEGKESGNVGTENKNNVGNNTTPSPAPPSSSNDFHYVCRRLGLPILPMSILVLRVLTQQFGHISFSSLKQKIISVVLFYAALMAVKVVLSLVLIGFSSQRLWDEYYGKKRRKERGERGGEREKERERERERMIIKQKGMERDIEKEKQTKRHKEEEQKRSISSLSTKSPSLIFSFPSAPSSPSSSPPSSPPHATLPPLTSSPYKFHQVDQEQSERESILLDETVTDASATSLGLLGNGMMRRERRESFSHLIQNSPPTPHVMAKGMGKK